MNGYVARVMRTRTRASEKHGAGGGEKHARTPSPITVRILHGPRSDATLESESEPAAAAAWAGGWWR